MKGKYIIAIFLFGFLAMTIGAYLKITHHENADIFLLVGTILKGLAILLTIIRLIRITSFKEFFNG